jgi:hypothetical protein
MLLTSAQSWDLRFQLPEADTLPAGHLWWTVWIPVRWPDSDDLTAESGFEDVDDWKDDVIPASSKEEAEALIQAAIVHLFGDGVDCGVQVEAA